MVPLVHFYGQSKLLLFYGVCKLVVNRAEDAVLEELRLRLAPIAPVLEGRHFTVVAFTRCQ